MKNSLAFKYLLTSSLDCPPTVKGPSTVNKKPLLYMYIYILLNVRLKSRISLLNYLQMSFLYPVNILKRL